MNVYLLYTIDDATPYEDRILEGVYAKESDAIRKRNELRDNEEYGFCSFEIIPMELIQETV